MRLEGSQVYPTPLLPMYKVELDRRRCCPTERRHRNFPYPFLMPITRHILLSFHGLLPIMDPIAPLCARPSVKR